jgi:hypothetical protein
MSESKRVFDTYTARTCQRPRPFGGSGSPLILRDYVQRHGIARTIGVFSSGYTNVVPDDLTGDDRREVPRIEAQDTGSAQTVAPRKVGESLIRILDRLMRGEEP